MNSINYLILFLLVTLTLFGCNKDEVTVKAYVPNIAPCEIPEEILEIDSIIYGPTAYFPHASLTITFVSSGFQIAFNKVPETGMYHIVPNLIGTYPWDNQIATVVDSGSYARFSGGGENAAVYIENYNSELIISYCDLPYAGYYTFDESINAYIGNPAGKRKIRMSY